MTWEFLIVEYLHSKSIVEINDSKKQWIKRDSAKSVDFVKHVQIKLHQNWEVVDINQANTPGNLVSAKTTVYFKRPRKKPQESKFCMNCGVVLPETSSECPSCGSVN